MADKNANFAMSFGIRWIFVLAACAFFCASPLHAQTPTLQSFTVTPSSIVGGSTELSAFTVVIQNAPPDTSTTVQITQACPQGLSGVGDVTISENQTTVTQAFTSYSIVTENTTCTITASLNGSSISQSITLTPLQVSISFSPSSWIGFSSDTSTGEVTINAPLNETWNVNMTSSPNAPSVPSSAQISQGQTSVSFAINNDTAVASATTSTVTASVGGDTGNAGITVLPHSLSISASPATVYSGGAASTVSVSLQPGLPYGWNGSVNVTASPAGCPGAGSIAVNWITSSGTYPLNPSSVTSVTSCTLTASWEGVTATSSFTIYPQQNPTGPCPDCNGQAGAPINLINGDTWITQKDYDLPGIGGGISIARTWNSLWQTENPVQLSGMFGNGWISTYEERIEVLDSTHVLYWTSNGSAWIMQSPSPGANYTVVTPENQHAILSVNATAYTLTFFDGAQHVFNLSGYLTTRTDPNGNQTNITYDSYGRISQVADAASRVVTFNYTATSAQVASIQDSIGTAAAYSYTNICVSGVCSNFLTQVAYPDGSQYNFAYTSAGLVSAVTDSAGQTLETHTYDSYDRGLTSSLANGVNLVTVSYPAFGSTQITNSLGYTTNYTYANSGASLWITNVSGPTCSTCGAPNSTSSTFDQNGNRLTSTDANGNTTTYTYDSLGEVLTRTNVVNGANATWSYTYNALGHILTVTDPLGNTTTNSYDSNGNLLTTTTPLPSTGTPGSKTTFTYDGTGNLCTVTDPNGNKTTLTHTTAGLISSIQDPKGNLTSYTYDARAHRLTATDALLKTTTFTDDAMGRTTKITYPDSSIEQFGFDNRGRRVSATDANGKVTTYAYDGANRLMSVTDAASNLTTYSYDTEDDLTSVVDANHNQTGFTYDSLRRLTKTTFPSAFTETYTYDNVGNRTSTTDRKNQTISYTYDTINRLTKLAYPDSTSESLTYDNDNRLLSATDSSGTYTLTYDGMSRLTSSSAQYAFLPTITFSTSFAFDASSNRISMTDPQGGITSYTYDSLNQMTSLTPPSALGAGTFGFTYDALGRRAALNRPNGVSTSYGYDALSRLLSVLHQVGATTLDGSIYTVDAAGSLKTNANQLTGLSSSYSYNSLYELTQVTQGAATTESYSYDPVGNRLSSLGVSTYAYNSSNELTSNSAATYTFDANGNTTSKSEAGNTTQYTWDYLNRLLAVNLPGSGGTVTFKYDPFGRRIQKIGASGTTNYVYDGLRLIETVDSSDNIISKYAQSPTTDEPLAVLTSGTVNFYEADAIGSVTSMTTSVAAIGNTYSFDSFGRVISSAGSISNPFQYAGREFDSDTGLIYNRARYLDPESGRFISEDPIRFAADGTDFYTYVENDPTDFTDPLGLKCCDVPAHPADADLDQNMNQTENNGYFWWYNEVKQSHGPWDYKWYHNEYHPEYDDFGNFNFGATACALHIPLQGALRGAGWAKRNLREAQGKTPPPGHYWGKYPYGNEPEKQQAVAAGWQWCKDGCATKLPTPQVGPAPEPPPSFQIPLNNGTGGAVPIEW